MHFHSVWMEFLILYFSDSGALMELWLLSGVRDENDRAYNPKIVRIGLKPHHSVQAVSMDYLVCGQQLRESLNFIELL